ncbi:hypothetical protein NDU88_007554 [Pleurodeles waltl]|uniref:Uncharacterized protein n=1 Tax=Pleurodeles waltl TaxID=8319 RepID=A0AAV7WHF8_PLEWA|nr:hypothetical protein NDU88_007554 [Pleurodeles waltl]
MGWRGPRDPPLATGRDVRKKRVNPSRRLEPSGKRLERHRQRPRLTHIKTAKIDKADLQRRWAPWTSRDPLRRVRHCGDRGGWRKTRREALTDWAARAVVGTQPLHP